MDMKRTSVTAMLLLLASAANADAYEFRVRFVERVGSSDTVLSGGNTIATVGGQEHRIRIQFGVFDDAEGTAPGGGYLGWNIGTITVNGGAADSDEFRNSPGGHHIGVGRLPPFNFAPASGGANGVPAGDPFEALTGIDNTLGTQSVVWNFGNPHPQPLLRGRNTWGAAGREGSGWQPRPPLPPPCDEAGRILGTTFGRAGAHIHRMGAGRAARSRPPASPASLTGRVDVVEGSH
jgi:hypothetical protein